MLVFLRLTRGVHLPDLSSQARYPSILSLLARCSSTYPKHSPLQTVPSAVDPIKPTSINDRPTREARAIYRQLPISSKKLTPVAKLVRRMRVEDALLQCDLLPKKGALLIQNAIRSAKANGVHNHKMDARKLYVDECFVTNGQNLKRIKYHGKGRAGRMTRRRTHLTVVLKEDVYLRPSPHRVVDTWLQRQERRAGGERNPNARVPKRFKIIPRGAKWKLKLKGNDYKTWAERKLRKKFGRSSRSSMPRKAGRLQQNKERPRVGHETESVAIPQ